MKQIEISLHNLFKQALRDGEKRKLVFWYDYEEEFVNDFSKIELAEVEIIHLENNNQFYVKHLLEEEDTEGSYLIYTNEELHTPNNWLYDTVLYADTFYADRVSLIMNELGIAQGLRATIQRYQHFFNNKERLRRFKELAISPYTEEKIELGMMNVICKTRSLDFETVLRTVFMDTLDDEDNRYLQDMDRYFDLDTFWEYVKVAYDYERETKTLETLFMHLVMTAFSRTMDEQYLQQFANFIAEHNKTNAYVFIDHWMHHKTDHEIFEDYIIEIEAELNVKAIIDDLPVEKYSEAEVFPVIDRAIIVYIANSLLERQEDYDDYLALIQQRRTKYFYEAYRNLYEALFYTVKMFTFKKEFTYGIPQGQAVDVYRAYERQYYEMDMYYRKFYIAYDAEVGSELLYKLKDEVENVYKHWYMGELGTTWTKCVQEEMEADWALAGVLNQQDFYRNEVTPHMDKNERAFVIISDALRYEAAVELQERLHGEIMGDIHLDTMLGVLPSVTKLGMAALLPHQSLSFDEAANVLVDGKNISGLDGRAQQLAAKVKDSIAVGADTLLQSSKASRRELLKGKKLIYIYHDTIDATGDDAATERDAFQAVEQALDQLSNLVRIIRNDLSGTHVYVTADHGFLYERDPLEVTDLMDKTLMDSVEVKRRYILSEENTEVSGQAQVDISSIVDNDPALYVYAPHATTRYRIQGGGRNFVHGGASLQEVMVPLLSIRNKRADQRHAQRIEKVQIHLTTTSRRITNSIFSLQFFQTEKIAEKRLARTVLVGIVDEDGEMLSNEETIIGDLTADNAKDRMFTKQFVLKNMTYYREKSYYLVIKDEAIDVILEKIPFQIDLGMASDFDF